jgi:hypothetical protein
MGGCGIWFEISAHLPLIRRNDVAIPPASPVGAVAQLGERLNGIQEVRGSIPLGSTSGNPASDRSRRAAASDLDLDLAGSDRCFRLNPREGVPSAGSPAINRAFDTTRIRRRTDWTVTAP